MKVLHVASECHPLIKTGGLADVLGALPLAEQQQGMDVRVVLPYYPQVREAITGTHEVASRDTFAGHVVFRYAEYRGIGFYLIDAPHLYDRPGNPYYDEKYQDYPDNVFRFALLGWAAAALATGLDMQWGAADILHAHDWQAGLAPAYLHHWGSTIKTIFTIHNIAYQGMFAARHVPEVWLPWEMYQIEGMEFNGQLSFLKAGLYFADRITTVSPSYAREITQEPAAQGMHGLLVTRAEAGRLSGILNGVDESVWHPQSDPAIKKHYTLGRMQGKKANKAQLQQIFALPKEENALLLVMVSRLTEQKGADLLIAAMDNLLNQKHKLNFQLAVLGTGAPDLEEALQALAKRHPKQIAVKLCYDETLSHQLIAGGDAIVVPSRFEPCGLTQLYGLVYGTLPIVRRTGGLADTVTDTNAETLNDKTACGFVFDSATPEALVQALKNALGYYHKPRIWASVRANAMRRKVGWQVAAKAYAQCYCE